MTNDLTTTVISKLVAARAASEARDGVSAGEYPVDFTVTVKGTVKVKEDTDKVPTVSIPIKETIGLFIARSGAMRAANIRLLAECIGDALAAKGGKGGATGSLTGEFDAHFGDVVTAFLAGLPKTAVKGIVDVKGVTFTVTEE
jgi:hypothetical protein